MKRIAAITVCIVMLLGLLSVTASAATATAQLKGPGTVRAGDTITLTLHLSGSNLLGVQGALSYDSNQVELKETELLIGNEWMLECYGNNFVIYDNGQKHPINGSVAILKITLKVKSNVAVGTTIRVSCTDTIASAGKEDIPLGAISYTTTIAPPASTDNNLKSLTVSNATISPAFSAGTTAYTAEVPFSVSKLDVKATANDSKAKVTVNSPNLTPGGTTKVTVTVTAENGSTKTYTIAVKREQDPNYVPSTNNDLSGITVDGFLLSPVFSSEITNYIIWLPYETESVAINGTAADGLASVRVEGGENLVAGADNEIKVICTAEDGTEKVYTIIAKRAPAHDGSTEPTEPTVEPTEPTVPAQTQPVTQPGNDATEPSAAPTEPAPVAGEGNEGVSTTILILVSAACLVMGLGVGFFVPRKRK